MSASVLGVIAAQQGGKGEKNGAAYSNFMTANPNHNMLADFALQGSTTQLPSSLTHARYRKGHDQIANPIGHCTQRNSSAAKVSREYLCRISPRRWAPCSRICEYKQRSNNHQGIGSALVLDDVGEVVKVSTLEIPQVGLGIGDLDQA